MVSLKFEHLSGKSWHFDMHRATATFERPTGLIATELNSPWDSIIVYDKASGRRAHKRQGVAKFVAKGAVSATFVVATRLEGGGVKKDILKDDKLDKRDKLAVLEARFASSYRNIADPELKAVADGFKSKDTAYLTMLIQEMDAKSLGEAVDLLAANTGSGKKAMPVLRKLLPLMVPELVEREQKAAAIGKSIECLYFGWETYISRLFLSQGGFLCTEGLASLLTAQQEANEQQMDEDAARKKHRQEAGIRRNQRGAGNCGWVSWDSCVAWVSAYRACVWARG